MKSLRKSSFFTSYSIVSSCFLVKSPCLFNFGHASSASGTLQQMKLFPSSLMKLSGSNNRCSNSTRASNFLAIATGRRAASPAYIPNEYNWNKNNDLWRTSPRQWEQQRKTLKLVNTALIQSLSQRGGANWSHIGNGDEHSAMGIKLNEGTINSTISTTSSTFTSSLSSLSGASTTTVTTTTASSGGSGEKPLQTSECSIRGERQYMEDDYYISDDGRFAAVFDGHGGAAVSRYLRQNLYANVQAALPTMPTLPSVPTTDVGADKEKDSIASLTRTFSSTLTTNKTESSSDENTLNESTIAKALCKAFNKVDNEVQGISHWSFQGSTALAVVIHETNIQTTSTPGRVAQLTKSTTQQFSRSRSVIAANVGDSRAILSHNKKAIDLTQDHKPNLPSERDRVESLGGSVEWFGEVNRNGLPIKNTGVYRINGNLALSRSIGDRSERPWITAEVDLTHFFVSDGSDSFVVLGTDGLFDVMSSQDVVSFVHEVLERSREEKSGENKVDEVKVKRNMSEMVVEEALRRGSNDNITVLIVWLDGV